MFDTWYRENDTWILFVFVLRDATGTFTSVSRALSFLTILLLNRKKNYWPIKDSRLIPVNIVPLTRTCIVIYSDQDSNPGHLTYWQRYYIKYIEDEVWILNSSHVHLSLNKNLYFCSLKKKLISFSILPFFNSNLIIIKSNIWLNWWVSRVFTFKPIEIVSFLAPKFQEWNIILIHNQVDHVLYSPCNIPKLSIPYLNYNGNL